MAYKLHEGDTVKAWQDLTNTQKGEVQQWFAAENRTTDPAALHFVINNCGNVVAIADPAPTA